MIGAITSLTGSEANYGASAKSGYSIAAARINGAGGIRGKRVRIDVLDDKGTTDGAVAAIRDLIEKHKAASVLGADSSSHSIAMAAFAQARKIPMITPSATNPKLTQQGYKTTFRLLANDNALGAGLALHAANNLKLKRVAIIDDRTAYGQGVAEVFKKTALARGMVVVDEQYTNATATDFMAILTAIKSKNPDTVFFGGMDPQAGPMLRQMDQLGMSNLKFFGGDGICTAKLPENSGNAKSLAGVVCAEGGASLEKMPGGTAWKARYDAKYPGQFQVYSPYVYDAVHVLVDAMVRAGSADPKVYLPKLFETNYQGVTTKVGFEADGELKNPAMTLYVYKDGKKVALN